MAHYPYGGMQKEKETAKAISLCFYSKYLTRFFDFTMMVAG